MPGHLAELLDAAEAAVLLAVVEDPLRDAGPDAVERVELLERRGVEVDRRRRGARRAADRATVAATARRGAGRRPPPTPAARPPPGTATARAGTSTCRPSSSLAARLTASRSARRAAPPARRSASFDARARRQPVEARAAHGTGDVDGDPAAVRAIDLDGRRRALRRPRRSRRRRPARRSRTGPAAAVRTVTCDRPRPAAPTRRPTTCVRR